MLHSTLEIVIEALCEQERRNQMLSLQDFDDYFYADPETLQDAWRDYNIARNDPAQIIEVIRRYAKEG